MLINEVSKLTKLTKKAIEYYTLQGLISPSISENGYRNYSTQDIENLNKISILRKLDISTEEIQHVLNDTTNSVLQTVWIKKELAYNRDVLKKRILQKLSQGASYAEISIELQSIEQSRIITDRLLEAFPGYYGRFVCMHFARFLNEPIKTDSQQIAYESILSFLDNIPNLDVPKDLEEYLVECTNHMGTEQISRVLEVTKESIQNPDNFLTNNKEVLDKYLEYKKSDEYKISSAFKLMELMKEFNNLSGYNDVFLPAMKQLSSSYAEYCVQLENVNKVFLEKYPEIEKLYNPN
ncbi:MAG: MerR family transcriptional regulator [Eubacteriales bacterium]